MPRGLVLCGGGSKGSYEMGAWTALKELNEEFDIVTGTSIGCLNAAMFASHAYDRCKELWDKIEVGMIMESGFNFENNGIKNSLKGKKDMVSFFGKYISNFGTDIKPFLKLMDDYLDVEAIHNSNIKFGICCAKFPSMKGHEVIANDLPLDQIKPFVLASASCFPIFPVCKIGKESYVDGGYYDNLPVNFALNLGATDLVVIDLNPNITHKEFLNKPYVRYIHPTRSLGSFMLFDRHVIDENMHLGYLDTMKAYGSYDGFRYTFNKNNTEIKGIRDYIISLANHCARLRRLGLKTVIKPERDGDIFLILEKYTDSKPLTDYDYFLRSLEVMAEMYSLDYLHVYNVKEMVSILFDSLIQTELIDDLLDGYDILKAVKKKEMLLKIEDKLLLRFFADRLFGNLEIDNELLLNLSLTKPNVFIGYMLLSAMMHYLGDFI